MEEFGYVLLGFGLNIAFATHCVTLSKSYCVSKPQFFFS